MNTQSIFPLMALFVFGACEEQRAVEPSPAVSPAEAQVEPNSGQVTPPSAPSTKPVKLKSPYTIAEQTPEEVSQGLKSACLAGQKESKPLLIEFSAAWCGDCRRLAELKQDATLAAQLKETPHFVVNVGRFDRHEELLDSFKIRAIANWQVVGTDACDTPPSTWKKLAHRTLEPRTGKKAVTAPELAQWLQSQIKGS